MKTRKRWVVIDTETDGLRQPIHIVEISAQLMEGWQAIAEPFRMLLNHNIYIPPEAVAIHGYTQAYLRDHGQDPVLVHTAFRAYAQNYPLVAHNLSYDWNRCLEPEWARLGIPPAGQRGFCSMMLARRLLSETTSYRLETLKQRFNLTRNRSHQALNDVLTVVELFQKVYRPRLEPVGLDSFESLAAFAKRTPVAKCLELIRSGPSQNPAAATLQTSTAPSPSATGRSRGCAENEVMQRRGVGDDDTHEVARSLSNISLSASRSAAE